MNKLFKYKSLVIVLIFFSLCSFRTRHCEVDRVIDGDTFVCGGERVRLIGIDCPETSYNSRLKKQNKKFRDIKSVIALGKKAKRYVERLLKPGTKVKLEFDVQKRDFAGRLLAYVWLPDGRMLNEVLLEKGYAMLLTELPNVKYLERFEKAYKKFIERRKSKKIEK